MRLRMTPLVFALALVSCGGTASLGWREATLSEGTKTYSVSGSFPVVVGLPEAKQNELNTRIKQLVDESVADFRRTVSAIPDANLKGKKSNLRIGYERATLTEKSVSFALNIDSSLAGAANPNSYVRTFNMDLTTMAPLAVTDIAGDLDDLSAKAKAILTNAAKTRGTYDATVAELISAGTKPVPENFSTFLVQSGSLLLLFSPYQVAPGSEGVQRISIPL